MSRRTKREVAPPPQTIAGCSSTGDAPVPLPYPYGPWFPTPPSQVTSSSFPPGWFASALSQAMAGSSAPGGRSADLTSGSTSAYPPPTAGMVDVLPDVEGWGRESHPPGGFVNYIKSPSNSVQLVLDGNQSQPINIDNAENEGATRTEKRLAWTKDEDLRLVNAWLNNSNDPIESNYKKNELYWKDVAAVYNSSTLKNGLDKLSKSRIILVKSRKRDDS